MQYTIAMTAYTRQLTHRIPLDRTAWHGFRCAIGWHPMARWELREFTMTRTEGRKTTEYTVWANVQEAICCGKSKVEVLV